MPTDILQSSSLLLVDDEVELREVVGELIAAHVKRVTHCGTGAEALDVLRSQVVDLVLLDVHMPNVSGPELLNQMRDAGIQTPVIFLTATPNDTRVIKLLGNMAYDVIEKPFRSEVILTRVRNALKAHADANRLHDVIEHQVIRSGEFDYAHEFDGMEPELKKKAIAAAKGVLSLRALNRRRPG